MNEPGGNEITPIGIVNQALEAPPQEFIPFAPANSHIEQVQKQGLQFEIPNRILRSAEISGLQRDRLVRLPSERDNQSRLRVIGELSKAIEQGTSWALLYSDSDNVKVANNYDRDLGDLAIRYGPAAVSSLIEKVGLGEKVKIVGYRLGDAADETAFLIINASAEELARLKEGLDNLKLQQANITIKNNEVPYEFSTTAKLLSHDDPEIDQDYLKETIQIVKNGGKAFEFYKKINTMLKTRVDEEKLVKDIGRISLEEFKLAGTRKAKDIILKRLSDSRVAGPTQELALTIMAVLQHIDPNTFIRPTTAKGWHDMFDKFFPENAA